MNLFLRSPLEKKDSGEVRICFWNLPGLTKESLNNLNILFYINKFLPSCDVFSVVGIGEMEDAAGYIENNPEFARYGFICLEGNAKPKKGNRTKSLACVRGEYTEDIEKIEFEEYIQGFENAPTLFLLSLFEKKILLAPVLVRPGIKIDIKNLQSVLEFSVKNFSDRRLFMGGSLYLDRKYHAIEFLVGIPFFLLLDEKIDSGTTFGNEKNDSIFTDSRTSVGCKGKVWNLQEFFPERNYKSDFEKISEHFPVSVDCVFK